MIKRADRADGFTVINNELLTDARLSDGALRLLVFMLTLPDDWNFSLNGLAHVLNWPTRKVGRLVTELKGFGYIEQVPKSDARGRFLPSEWVIHETPVTAIRENRRAVEPQNGNTAERTDRRADAPQSGLGVDIQNTNINQILNITKDEVIQSNKRTKKFQKPTVDEVAEYCQERGNNVDPNQFIDHYEANGWKIGGRSPMRDWKAAVRTWERNNYDRPRNIPTPQPKKSTGNEFLDLL